MKHTPFVVRNLDSSSLNSSFVVKSESEIRKMTKVQLKQWLTKHDQRLPPNDNKLKKYYLNRAITYFHLLQKEESKMNNYNDTSQSRSRLKKKVISNTRTKKKTAPKVPLTPKSRTQRRHSSNVSPSPSLNRSKRIIKLRRKTPTKQSPSLKRSIKKKRERVRRATADHSLLQKEIEAHYSSETDEDDVDISDIVDIADAESENGGDYNNIYSKGRHINDPERMTIGNLQQWLDDNNIDFVFGERKAVYVNLVKKYSSKKRFLSPKHKKYTSPSFKKQKQHAPLPSDIHKSPLTPRDDEKTQKRMLLTPVINKVDTPSKLAMRDEIRSLLSFDDDEPLYSVNNDSKITPGAPLDTEYDANELENVLTDLKRENKPSKPQERVKVYDPHKYDNDRKDSEDIKAREAPSSVKRNSSYIAKRTVPSPASPQQSLERTEITSPIQDYEEPMSPAINNYNERKNDYKEIENKKDYNYNEIQYKKQFESNQNKCQSQNATKNLSPMKLPFEVKNKADLKKEYVGKRKGKGRCITVLKVLSLAVFGAAIACLFVVFDVESVMNTVLEDINEYISNFEVEKNVVFCDTGVDRVDCVPCPVHSVICSAGRVECKTNYILHDNKCVLDGVVVKFAYNLNKQIGRVLSLRKGKYECGEMDGIGGYTMNEDELMSICDVFDAEKKLDAFSYFKMNILSESSVISVNSKGEYFSYKSIKSPICRIKEYLIANILGLMAIFIVIVIVFTIWLNYKGKEWEKKEIDNMISSIYNILDEFDKFNAEQHVAVDVIKQRIKPKSNKLWKKVDILIKKDVGIHKSIRMIDGMQKRCLALSSVVRINNGNSNRYGKESVWSPAIQRHKQF